MTARVQARPPQVKGWCPGALRPMQSGDGWVVRIRPRAGRLSQLQAAGIADAAEAFGSGHLDLSSRANLQIRGVPETTLPPLIDALRALDLIDPTPEAEGRRNVLLTPFADAATRTLATALETRLAQEATPALPGKFGFVVDSGARPVLQSAPGDIRIERAGTGDLLICADGFARGRPTTARDAVEDALQLARHFAARGGITDGRGRMAAFAALPGALPGGFDVARQQADFRPVPGATDHGALVALRFGQIDARTLRDIATLGALRLTPWRMLLIEAAAMPDLPTLITRADDPMLRVVACPGAPSCAQGLGPTRPLAERLAARVQKNQTLHVSGCAKGCAHPRAAGLTVVATGEGYDLIRRGTATDAATLQGQTAQQIEKAI